MPAERAASLTLAIACEPPGELDALFGVDEATLRRVKVVDHNAHDLAQVRESFLVQPVLDVDLGLLEQLGKRGCRGRSRACGGTVRWIFDGFASVRPRTARAVS